MELSVFDDPRIKPIVDKEGNRVIYRAIVSRGSETRIIWGCVKEMVNGRVRTTTPKNAWELGTAI
jgi:hypothetical protein